MSNYANINGIANRNSEGLSASVGNAKKAAYFYRSPFGMRLTAYRLPETGARDRASWLVEQGKIRLVLTTAPTPEHPVAEHVRLHGDGVRDIALWVDDAESAYRETTRRGSRGVREPEILRDEHGGCASRPSQRMATRSTHSWSGGTIAASSSLVSCRCSSRYRGAAGWTEVHRSYGRHVGWGTMSTWVDFAT